MDVHEEKVIACENWQPPLLGSDYPDCDYLKRMSPGTVLREVMKLWAWKD